MNPPVREYTLNSLSANRGEVHIAGRDGIPEARVVIDRIDAHPAHSTPDGVAYAAVFAVWRALGVEGSLPPALPGKPAEPGASADGGGVGA